MGMKIILFSQGCQKIEHFDTAVMHACLSHNYLTEIYTIASTFIKNDLLYQLYEDQKVRRHFPQHCI